MAKQTKNDAQAVFRAMRDEVMRGEFAPVYVLAGDEPFYADRMLECLLERVLQPHERDFNQTVVYGGDTDGADLAALCSRYPMMAERQLVVVREAQQLKRPDELEPYLLHPLESTVLVLVYGGKPDRRTRFVKTLLGAARVLESDRLPDWSVPGWIEDYAAGCGASVDPRTALLLADYVGNDLRRLAMEIGKLLQALPPDDRRITPEAVERHIGVSREFNAVELGDALAAGDAPRAFRIVHYLTASSRTALPPVLGYLFYFFYRLELIQALMRERRMPAQEAGMQAGVRYMKPFLPALQRYPLESCFRILAWIRDTDYKSKSNLGGEAGDGDLLRELVSRIIDAGSPRSGS